MNDTKSGQIGRISDDGGGETALNKHVADRVIKFRAWARANQEMFMLDDAFEFDNGVLTEVPNTIVMQYTGLKDKNGVEIYEGDIVIGGEPNDSGGWTYNDVNDHKTVVKWSTSYKPGFDFPQMCEIIGSIYENPELIDTQKVTT